MVYVCKLYQARFMSMKFTVCLDLPYNRVWFITTMQVLNSDAIQNPTVFINKAMVPRDDIHSHLR